MNIEPKSITVQDFKDSYKEAFEILKKNSLIYILMWMPLILLVYIVTEIEFLFFTVPVLATITYYSLFELTCTLFVGFNGSIIDKLKISLSAGANICKVILKNEIIWILVCFMLFIYPAVRMFLSEDTSKLASLVWMSYWSIFLAAYCLDPFAGVKQGCISMFLNKAENYGEIKQLFRKAIMLNIPVVLRSLLVCMFSTVMLIMFPYFLPIVATVCAVTSFCMFCKIFEPPQMKVEEKVLLENELPTPELT